MSRDGFSQALFRRPPSLIRPHYLSTWIAGFAVGVPAGIFAISDAADLSNIGTLFAFVLVSLGVIILRRTQPGSQTRLQGAIRPLVPADLHRVCAAA
jgi:APA family basic amino acid/polyamine antiporter